MSWQDLVRQELFNRFRTVRIWLGPTKVRHSIVQVVCQPMIRLAPTWNYRIRVHTELARIRWKKPSFSLGRACRILYTIAWTSTGEVSPKISSPTLSAAIPMSTRKPLTA